MIKTNRKILCLIGARGGSKGVPNKNIKDLGGFPLLAYPIVASFNSNWIDRTLVSSDCKLITAIASKYKAETLVRPTKYATDTSTDFDWITHALRHLKKQENYKPDLIVHLRATTPLVEAKIIDLAIAKLSQVPEATALRSVHALSESPYKMFTKEKDFLKSFMSGEGEFYNQPRQKFPNVYIPNGYVDVIKPSTLKEGTLHGSNILCYETDEVIEVDREYDLIKLQSFYEMCQTHEILRKL